MSSLIAFGPTPDTGGHLAPSESGRNLKPLRPATLPTPPWTH